LHFLTKNIEFLVFPKLFLVAFFYIIFSPQYAHNQNKFIKTSDKQDGKQIKPSTNSEEKIYLFIDSGSEYFKQNNYDDALLQFQKALTISQALGYNSLIHISLEKISETYQKMHEYTQALKYAKQVLKWAKLTGQLEKISVAYYQIAYTYYLMGDFEQSLGLFHKSLTNLQKFPDKSVEGMVYNGLGNVYWSANNNEKALSNYSKALEVYQLLKDDTGMANTLSNLANYYTSLGNYPQVLMYQFKVKAIREKLKDDFGLATTLNDLGYTYELMNDLEPALQYYRTSFIIQNKVNNKWGIANTANNLASVFIAKNQADSAKFYLKSSLKFSEKVDNPELKTRSYQLYAKLYETQGDFEKAYRAYQYYETIKDSVFREQRINKLKQSQIKLANAFEKEENKSIKKDQVISQKVNELNKLKLVNRQNAIYALSLVIVLGLALLILLYNRSRTRGLNAKEFEKQVKERTLTLEKITRKLTNANQELDTFLYKASHDLKGPLASLEGLANLGYAEATQDSKMKEYFQRQKNILRNMELKLFKIVEIGEIRNHVVRRGSVRLQRYIKRMVRSMNRVENYRITQFTINVDKNTNIYTDLDMLDIALDNVIRNALEHSITQDTKKSLKIVIDAYEKEESWEIYVKNSGQIIPKDSEDKIFEMFFKGSNSFQSFGLGLYKAKIAMDKIGGNVFLDKNIESEEENEIRFAFQIPKTALNSYTL